MNNDFDRRTALEVLKDVSSVARASRDLFGDRILCIRAQDFERIRSKWLGNNEEESE